MSVTFSRNFDAKQVHADVLLVVSVKCLCCSFCNTGILNKVSCKTGLCIDSSCVRVVQKNGCGYVFAPCKSI